MNQAEYLADNPYATFGVTAAEAPAEARLGFIRKTYTHLAAAIYAFVLLEYALFKFGAADAIMSYLGQMRWAGLIFLGAFLLVSWCAHAMARSRTSRPIQYAGLFLYVAFEAVIFVPLLSIAQGMSINQFGVGNVDVITAAGATTLIMFGGLTAFVFLTRTDFSFLRTALFVGGIAAFALLLFSALAGFHLGVLFSVAMIVLACGWILYDTSQILHHHSTDQYVAASLELFASVALLFWYVLRFMLAFANND